MNKQTTSLEPSTTPKRAAFAAMLAAALLTPACGDAGGGGDDGDPDELGACVIAGDGIKDSCYEDMARSDCEGSFDTFHAGSSCPSAGYTMECCSGGNDDPSLYRPAGGACDASQHECGTSTSTDCYGSCVDACLQAGGSSCGADCSDLCDDNADGGAGSTGGTSGGSGGTGGPTAEDICNYGCSNVYYCDFCLTDDNGQCVDQATCINWCVVNVELQNVLYCAATAEYCSDLEAC